MEQKMITIPFDIHIAFQIQRNFIHGVLETEYGDIKVPDIKKAKCGDILVYGSSSICRVIKPFGICGFLVGAYIGPHGACLKRLFEHHQIEGFATDSMIKHAKETLVRTYEEGIDNFFNKK